MSFELRGITFGYPGKNTLFHHLNLHIGTGDFILLRGPSGSGKSTFLRLLNRLIVPQEGEIFYKDKPLSQYDVTVLRRRVIYLQQLPIMLDATVRENLLLPFTFKSSGRMNPPNGEVLKDFLQAFRLSEVTLEDNAQNLSVGQKQRLVLIRALLLDPEVLLLDEPTASLDRHSREVVEEKVEALNVHEGVGIIMVSHTDYVPQKVKPRILVLKDGRVEEDVL